LETINWRQRIAQHSRPLATYFIHLNRWTRSKSSAERISAKMVTTRRGLDVRQAQPVVNMEFISVLMKTFLLLIPNGDFILHFPLDGK
jgi:hypothetical protein